MGFERRVKLFKNGRSQAVRIPAEIAFQGDEVVLRQDGDRVIIEPVRKKSLLELLATLEPIDEEIGEIEDLPPDPVDL